MTDGLAVQITIRGRVGPVIGQAFAMLDMIVVPRHNVLLVGSGDIHELLAILRALSERGIEVDRITQHHQPPTSERGRTVPDC